MIGYGAVVEGGVGVLEVPAVSEGWGLDFPISTLLSAASVNLGVMVFEYLFHSDSSSILLLV